MFVAGTVIIEAISLQGNIRIAALQQTLFAEMHSEVFDSVYFFY